MSQHTSAQAAAAAMRRLSRKNQLALSAFWLSLNFQSTALLPVVIPLQIAVFITPNSVGSSQQVLFLGWLSAIGSVTALIIQPVIGVLSDHTFGPYGRRRPYVAAGTMLMISGSFILAVSANVPAFVFGFLITQVAGNTATAAYQALIPDIAPEDQRGEASGYMGIMTILGSVGSLIAAGMLFSEITAPVSASAVQQSAVIFYGITIAIMALGAFVTIIGVHEESLTRGQAQQYSISRRAIRNLWTDPWSHPNFVWVFLTRAFVMLGITLFMTFIEYYVSSVYNAADFVRQTVGVASLALISGMAGAFIFGALSDKIGRIGIVCFASICMSAAAGSFVVLPAGFPLWPLGVVFGVGYGAYMSTDWAMAIDTLPSGDDFGKDMGIWSLASTVPSIIAPLLGSLVINGIAQFAPITSGYRAVFIAAVVFLLLGAVFVLKIKEKPAAAVVFPVSGGVHTGAVRPRRVSTLWRLAFSSHSGKARGFLLFWPVWERIMMFFTHPQEIPGSTAHIIHIATFKYAGKPFFLSGEWIQRGDLICELHLNNQLIATAYAVSSPFEIIAAIRQDLTALAQYMEADETGKRFKAIFGITLLSRAAKRIGFTVRDRPVNVYTRMERFFLSGLLTLYSSEGVNRLAKGHMQQVRQQEIWMTTADLLEHFLQRPEIS